MCWGRKKINFIQGFLEKKTVSAFLISAARNIYISGDCLSNDSVVFHSILSVSFDIAECVCGRRSEQKYSVSLTHPNKFM
jgi:hypothetical protein